jgi:hypothetical protein
VRVIAPALKIEDFEEASLGILAPSVSHRSVANMFAMALERIVMDTRVICICIVSVE